MLRTKKANAVRNLVSLYTVVIGVALSLAVVTVIDPNAGLSSVDSSSLLLFAAFVETLLPFYHGALRHLDDAYIENPKDAIGDSVLIVDFVLLFFHALAFVVLALLVRQPAQFAWVLISVLVIDVVWALITYAASSAANRGAEGRWGLINLTFVAIWASYLVANGIWFESQVIDNSLSVLLAISCLLRTVMDYVWCRDFYFPR